MARELTSDERELLSEYFGESFALERIRVAQSIGRRCWSPYGSRVSMVRACFDHGDPRAPLRLRDPRVAATLAHEALHVWQRTRGVWVTARGAVLQTGYALRLGNPYRYEPSEDPAELLERFVRGNVEQQGQIFEDYVRAQRSGADTRAFVAVAAHVRGEH